MMTVAGAVASATEEVEAAIQAEVVMRAAIAEMAAVVTMTEEAVLLVTTIAGDANHCHHIDSSKK